jgi:hypothetical protein
MKERIEIGDIVSVFFERSSSLSDVEVLYMPIHPNENWVFKSPNGDIHYVYQFVEVRWIKPVEKSNNNDDLPW